MSKMAVDDTIFSKEEEFNMDTKLGYPKAYAKLCKDTTFNPYINNNNNNNSPPFNFTPFKLNSHQASKAKELDELFPIINPGAKPTSKTRIFISILWKQLNHLGNAGFDPAMFRVDPYGNVLYFHADPASPLAWAIDHWFPCSRGGLTVPANLRILQWQVCKRKCNQLEFLVPWWDFQLGVSINQFLSIFAAVNSDFRHRAFRWLFSAGENEELNDLQTVGTHSFPKPFLNSKDQIGLAPAALVCTHPSSTLRSLDFNRQPRPTTPMIAPSRKLKNSKENENPEMVTNPYQAIVKARDSLKQREGSGNKMKAEIQRIDDEVGEVRVKNEEEKVKIQELEMCLIKRRRWAEKCRKLAEAQAAHKAMLERMISNAMHQSVMYKEQLSLNQAATNTLMARLEAQIAISNSAEKDLYIKFKQRDKLEKQIRLEPEQARKRSRTENAALLEEKQDRSLIYLPRIQNTNRLHKELREFLEEEQRLSEEARSMIEEDDMEEEKTENPRVRFSFDKEEKVEEDEESRKERGKGNVEKWLQILLDDSEKRDENTNDEIVKRLNEKYPQKEIKVLKLPNSKNDARSLSTPRRSVEIENTRSMSTPRRSSYSCEARKSFEDGNDVSGNGKGSRSLRHFPSSPSMIIRSSINSIKKVVKI